MEIIDFLEAAAHINPLWRSVHDHRMWVTVWARVCVCVCVCVCVRVCGYERMSNLCSFKRGPHGAVQWKEFQHTCAETTAETSGRHDSAGSHWSDYNSPSFALVLRDTYTLTHTHTHTNISHVHFIPFLHYISAGKLFSAAPFKAMLAVWCYGWKSVWNNSTA